MLSALLPPPIGLLINTFASIRQWPTEWGPLAISNYPESNQYVELHCNMQMTR